jgi:hypothetical protein
MRLAMELCELAFGRTEPLEGLAPGFLHPSGIDSLAQPAPNVGQMVVPSDLIEAV